MKHRTVIYALADESGEPRYVGQTDKLLSTRLSQHRSFARNASRSRPLDQWLRGCPGATIIPLEVSPPDPDEAERRWISQMRTPWHDLLNITSGGKRSYTGVPHSPEVLEAIAAKRRGTKASPETRAKLSAAHKGVPLSADHRAAIGRGSAALERHAEWRRHLSESKRGDKNPMSAKSRAARAELRGDPT